jgi:hypothetical protein
MPGREADRLLTPATDKIIRWTLERIATLARENGSVPVFVALNVVTDPEPTETQALKDASSAGLLVFNLLELWTNRDQTALRIADWDEHPNAAGNRLIADHLVELMAQHAAQLRLPLSDDRRAAGYAEGGIESPEAAAGGRRAAQ